MNTKSTSTSTVAQNADSGAMLQPEIDNGPETETLTFSLLKQEFSAMGAKSFDQSVIPAEGISFYIMRLARVIVVRTEGNFFIGRNVQKDSWNPQVNLAELDGFASSVSRRHAMIHPLEHGYEITDLFSRNGTRLDDRPLMPNKAYPLVSGAQLIIGQEQLMVIYSPAR